MLFKDVAVDSGEAKYLGDPRVQPPRSRRVITCTPAAPLNATGPGAPTLGPLRAGRRRPLAARGGLQLKARVISENREDVSVLPRTAESGGGRTASARQSDVHEETPVKTGARRLRYFPDIHSASSVRAERHESVCGSSRTTPRRRNATRRTSGCDPSPATDPDMDGIAPLAAYVITTSGLTALR
jgi:hypothetical protein